MLCYEACALQMPLKVRPLGPAVGSCVLLLLRLRLLLLAHAGCVLQEGADVRQQLLHRELQAAQVG
jgi:hypothetical protein